MTKQTPRPYGATSSEGRYERFIAATGWKYNRHAYCLHWISHGRRCRCYDNKDHYAWMDHTSGYVREAEDGTKERLLLCQPYFLNEPDTLIAAADEFDLEFGISGRGWYGHGTVTIELTPRGQHAREYERSLERAREQVRERQLAAGVATVVDKILKDWDDED